MEIQPRSGLFVVLDGIDGCGKSSQAERLFNYFKKKSYQVHLTSEPSKGELGTILRQYLKKPENPAVLDALMFAADRIDHCYSEIIPKLNEDAIVICDRYRDSSLIYQSIQGQEEGLTPEWITSINKFSLNPDLTFIFDLDPKLALQRKIKQNSLNVDAMEKFEEISFQEKIRLKFKEIALRKHNKQKEATKYFLIDGAQSLEDIFFQLIKYIEEELHLRTKKSSF